MIIKGQTAPIIKGGKVLPVNLRTFQKVTIILKILNSSINCTKIIYMILDFGGVLQSYRSFKKIKRKINNSSNYQNFRRK